jgi:hypothetical protein
MAKFLTGNELNAELETIFEKAESLLVLISPYIKLHDRYASTLRAKKDNHKLKIIIVFGKNEEDISKSMKQEDFMFFKDFPNIQIRYEKRLHAKYYANDSSAILTSMNLYDYSQDKNIEAGVLAKVSILGNIANNIMSNVTGEDGFDNQAWTYFKRVIDQSELLFERVPQYDNGLLGIGKKYRDSKIEIDELSKFFGSKSKSTFTTGNTQRGESNRNPPPISESKRQSGFCIRTGKPINFNPKMPFCDDAYQSWSNFKNEEYPEKYCHYSGEPSNGETTKARPILRKNWSAAKREFNL